LLAKNKNIKVVTIEIFNFIFLLLVENFKKLLDLLKKDPPTGGREKWGGSFQA
jgi:hypothetical protein